MELVSMKLDKKGKKDHMGLSDEHRPEYPFGLQIDLENESLEKLKISELPKVGEKMSLMVNVEVVSVGSHSHQEGEDHNRVGLQITDLGIKSKEEKSKAEKVYGEE